jgi:hypothetical protein
VTAANVLVLSEATSHVSGWNAFDWFLNVVFALAGWAMVATPVVVMHRLETYLVEEPPPPVPASSQVTVSPAAPEGAPVTVSAWEYYVIATAVGLAGAILGATFGWLVARHLEGAFLVIVWWMVPFICFVGVTMYWLFEDRLSEVKRSKSGWAAAIAALIYAAVGTAIAGADLIIRLASQASLTSDGFIVLLLIGVLGWALWLFGPHRRARG